MKSIFLLFVSLVFVFIVQAQSFEGKIIYQNSYESKVAQVSSEQFAQMLGTKQEYFVSGANYKSITNGSMVKEQLYLGVENKLYSVVATQPEPQVTDASTVSEEVVKSEITKSKEKVLGIKCKKLVVETNNGSSTYFFNPKYSADPTLYEGHQFGGWYHMLSQTKAIPLKIVMETPQFILTSEATSIEELDLDEAVFKLSE